MRAGTRVASFTTAGLMALGLAASVLAAPAALAIPPSTCNGLAITLQAVPVGAGGGVITAAMSPGNDVIGGTMRDDVIDGGGGDDTICGWDGADDIDGDQGGEPGDDWISGGAQNDIVDGNEGNDTLWGNDNNDEILGSSGNDFIRAGTGDDEVNAGPGDDFVHCASGTDLAEGSTHVFGDVLSANHQCEVFNGFNP